MIINKISNIDKTTGKIIHKDRPTNIWSLTQEDSNENETRRKQ